MGKSYHVYAYMARIPRPNNNKIFFTFAVDYSLIVLYDGVDTHTYTVIDTITEDDDGHFDHF